MRGSGRERWPQEAYFTIDPLAVDTLAEHLDLMHLRVWEPCCGQGHMVRDLRRHGAQVVGSDLHAYPDTVAEGLIQGLDFFRAAKPPLTTAIVTNPPYREAARFLARALELDPPLVCMLLRHEWVCRKGEIHENRLARWIPIRGRLRWVEGPKRPAPRHNFAWGVWTREGAPRWGGAP